jgi:cytochrome c6
VTKIYSALVQTIVVVLILVSCIETEAVAGMSPGQEAFERNCYVCHPKGGNVINPAKTLHNKDLEKNNILKAADIINKMRNPGPGMTKFDEAIIPDTTAQAIAEYILRTFR